MNINLDRLLDNDKLYPEQERYVRKLLSYRIERVSNGELILYFRKRRSLNKKRCQLNAYADKDIKVNAYKHVMYYLITFELGKVPDKLFRAKCYEKISKTGNRFENNEPINMKSQDLFKLLLQKMEIVIYE